VTSGGGDEDPGTLLDTLHWQHAMTRSADQITGKFCEQPIGEQRILVMVSDGNLNRLRSIVDAHALQ
jgi:hypothetical protein